MIFSTFSLSKTFYVNNVFILIMAKSYSASLKVRIFKSVIKVISIIYHIGNR